MAKVKKKTPFDGYKKMIYTALTALILALCYKWGIPTESALTIVSPLLGLLGIEGVADIASRLKSK